MPARSRRCGLCGERYKVTELDKREVLGSDLHRLETIFVCKKCFRTDSRKKRVL